MSGTIDVSLRRMHERHWTSDAGRRRLHRRQLRSALRRSPLSALTWSRCWLCSIVPLPLKSHSTSWGH